MKCGQHFGLFGVRYNGEDLLTIIEGQRHPALRRKAGAPVITHGILYDEWEAAERYGYAAYWNSPREARAFMCASIKARSVISLMAKHDHDDITRREMEAERKRRGRT